MTKSSHRSKRQKAPIWVGVIFLVLLFAGAGVFVWKNLQGSGIGSEEEGGDDTVARFEAAVEKRDWKDAEMALFLLEAEGRPDGELAGWRSILEAGRQSEFQQEVAFVIGRAQEAIDLGELDVAETLLGEAEEMSLQDERLTGLRVLLEEGRMVARKGQLVEDLEKALRDERLHVARELMQVMREEQSGHEKFELFQEQLGQLEKRRADDLAKAERLMSEARLLDEEEDEERILVLVAEAVKLDPSEENRRFYERLTSKGRILRVPKMFATISSALDAAEKNDRVWVAKGLYRETLLMRDGVELVGEDAEKTVIEYPAGKGAVITVVSQVDGARLSKLTLRHGGLVGDEERFPVVAVDGGGVELNEVTVKRASGHGVAVLAGGRVTMLRGQVLDSGWDGVSVTGESSRVKLIEVVTSKNLHHGVDFWDGASGYLKGCALLKNGMTGLLAMSSEGGLKVEDCRFELNGEVGVSMSGVRGGDLVRCSVKDNLLGGVLIEKESQLVTLIENRIEGNGEAGLILEKNVEVVKEEGNVISRNTGKQVWRDAVFPDRGEVDPEDFPPPPPPPVD